MAPFIVVAVNRQYAIRGAQRLNLDRNEWSYASTPEALRGLTVDDMIVVKGGPGNDLFLHKMNVVRTAEAREGRDVKWIALE